MVFAFHRMEEALYQAALWGLSLNGTDHDALHKVLLDEGVHTDDGHGGYHNGGVLHDAGHGLQLCGSRGVGAGISSVHVGDQEQFAQPQLQGVLIPVAEENHGVEVGVPVANRHVQGNNRNDGLGQGDGNLENKPGVGAAIDGGGFKQVVGQRVREVGTDQDDVVHRDAANDDHQEAGVHQAQVVDDDVEGDHAALEVHGEDEQLHDDAVARKVLSGEGVAGNHGAEGADDSAAHGVQDGVGIANPDVHVGDGTLVAQCGKPFGIEQDVAVVHVLGVGT